MNGDRGWRIAAASAQGTSHAKRGISCQDSATAKVFAGRDGKEVLVVAASDGAGSAPKAADGSRLACSTVIEAAEGHLLDGGNVADFSLDLARSWVCMVQKAISMRAEDEGLVPRDYACTLLVAVLGGDAAAIVQIGDGAVVVSDEEGGWCWVHWPQRGEFANSTFFVTEGRATERIAFDLCRRRIDEIAPFTDGLEPLVLHYPTKTVFEPFFHRMFPALRASEAEGIDAKLSMALDSYLNSPAICERTDDDKTLVLASRGVPVVLRETSTPTPETHCERGA